MLKAFKFFANPGTDAQCLCPSVRVERRVAALMTEANFNREILRYLNRLSDACRLLARYAERAGKTS
jgi:cob(I)alamin adenosyltransferase